MTRNTVPGFADDYPDRATKLEHLGLTFYCINCQRKKETTYVTPNFGPFCDDCMEEIPDLSTHLEWALQQLAALVTEGDDGCFVRGRGIELAGFGQKVDDARRALKAVRR